MARARTLTLKTKVEVTGADKLNNLGQRMQSIGRNLTVGVTLPLIGAGGAMVALAEEAARADAELTRTFDSMGAAAWTTVDALKANQKELQSLTTFGDEEISHLQSVLLTFGNVTGESFERATAAALDMSTLLGQDLQSSAVQLGKALNDPITGLTALRRVGVSFTEQQREQIRVMTEAGDVAAAQGIILSEVERQFGGAAEAIAETAGGQLKQALNELSDAGEEFGAVIAPMLKDLAGFLKDVAKWLQSLNPETKEWVVRIGALAAALGPLLIVIGSLVRALSGIGGVIRGIPGSISILRTAFGPAGLIGIVAAATVALDSFIDNALSPLSDEMRNLAQSLGEDKIIVEKTLSGLAGDVGESFEDVERRVLRVMDNLGVGFDEAVRIARQSFKDLEKPVDDAAITWAEGFAAIQDAAYDGMLGPNGALPIIEGAVDDMAEEVGGAPQAMADELLANQFHLTDATEELVRFMQEAISPAQEMMNLQGFLSSQELAQGLASNNPLIRQKSEEMRDAALSRLYELQGAAYTNGANTASALAAGINDNVWRIQAAAYNAASQWRDVFPSSEPKDPRSPFRGITKAWGFMDVLAKGLSHHSDAAALRQALGVDLAALSIRPIEPLAASGGRGDIHIHLTVMGDLRADERTLPGTLRRAFQLAGDS